VAGSGGGGATGKNIHTITRIGISAMVHVTH
jgi:hypothetical protein